LGTSGEAVGPGTGDRRVDWGEKVVREKAIDNSYQFLLIYYSNWVPFRFKREDG
jgi:hypothetical protein